MRECDCCVCGGGGGEGEGGEGGDRGGTVLGVLTIGPAISFLTANPQGRT